MPQQVKMKKIKTIKDVNGVPMEVEIEVPDLPASWGSKKDRKAVGGSQPRVDGPEKVTGRAKYTYDINLPGMLHGKILRSPHARARVKSIDLSGAQSYPGVRAVYSLKKPGDGIFYAGTELAALAADSPEIAEDAIRAIKVSYDILPHVVKEDAARQEGAAQALGNRPNVNAGRSNARGDVAGGFAKAKAVYEGEFKAQARVHGCLETHGHVVAYQPDGTLKVWASTQAVHSTADEFAGITQVPRDKIEVVCQYMGGGFGSKFGPGIEGDVCQKLAKQTGRPVKLMLDRREEVESAGNAPSAVAKYKIAAAADGTLTAIQGRGYGTGGIGGAGVPLPYPIYKFESQDVAQDTVFTNLGPSNAMRAPGHPQGSFLTESGIDELAYQLGMDPLDLRLKNDTAPVRQEQYRIGAERIGWKQKFNHNPGKGGPLVRGVGCAGGTWGGRGGNPQMKAEVRIGVDGSVVVAVGTQDLGTGVRTFIRSIVADELQLPFSKVRSEIGSSKLPLSGGSGGSTTTPMVAPPVKIAAMQARVELLQALAKATGEKLENLSLGPDGTVSNGQKTLSWVEACKRLPAGGVSTVGTWNDQLVQGPIHGVQFAEVEVDMQTGKVRVRKLLCVQDAGIIMNRMTFTSQINGGMIQGMSFALLEDRIACQNTGRVMNANFDEYKMPGTLEIPELEVVIYEPDDVKGVSGVAEAPVIPTAAAIANAVRNACGARISALPITPAKVLAALGKVKA